MSLISRRDLLFLQNGLLKLRNLFAHGTGSAGTDEADGIEAQAGGSQFFVELGDGIACVGEFFFSYVVVDLLEIFEPLEI